MPYLVRKYPKELCELAYVSENRPIQGGDPPPLVLKKLVKRMLARHRCSSCCTVLWARSRPLTAPSVCSGACTRCCWASICSAGFAGHGGRRAKAHDRDRAPQLGGRARRLPAIDRARDRGRVGRADRGGQRIAGPQCRDRPRRVAAGAAADPRPQPGFCRGNERGAFPAVGRYWLLLNPDVVASLNGLETLVHWMDAHPAIAAASPELCGDDGRLRVARTRDPVDSPHAVRALATAPPDSGLDAG